MIEILAHVADLHINSSVALCNPRVVLDDGGEYVFSKGQRWPYQNWVDYWDTVKALKKKHKAKVIVFFGGDTAEADIRKRSAQIISVNEATMGRMVLETLEQALKVGDTFFVIRGTPAHVGKSAQFEEMLGKDIGAEKHPSTGTYSWFEFYGRIGGVLFDIAHHGSLGRLPWTRSNALNSLATRLILKYARWGMQLPKVAIRSHNHCCADTWNNYPVRVIASPCWTLKTEHSHRIGIVELPDIGGIIAICEKGDVKECLVKTYPLEKQSAWSTA